MMSTAGAMFAVNSMKLRWAPVPMMMLVGFRRPGSLPPAMLAVRASTMRNGAGLTASRSHTSRVTGAINRTVVTVCPETGRSERSDHHQQDHDPQRGSLGAFGPTRLRRIRTPRSGAPTLTMIIIPRSKKRTSQLTPGVAGVEDPRRN